MFCVDKIKIEEILKETSNPDPSQLREVLSKASEKKGLELKDVALLCQIKNREIQEEMFSFACKVKLDIYGNRIVLFAPLYVSNWCTNDCLYCGFHTSNKELERKKLSLDELKEEVSILEGMGHKRLLLEFGEDPINNSIDYVVDVIKTIYETKNNKGEIRRINVNIAATSVENYRKLKDAGIGTYQLFQETYHRPTYEKLHCGPKANYERQITAHERAFEGGIDDLGIGVLFGLYDWRFEVLSLVAYSQYMDEKLGVGPHTISVPRFNPAPTVQMFNNYIVSDRDFEKIIAVLRLAVPYTGMIISTRESPAMRRKAFGLGISQASAASSTIPGGYRMGKKVGQFTLHDHRSLDDVIKDLCKEGFLPSFCTACYRLGRTGDYFMEFAKSGNIQKFCHPNALLTFAEYLEDYASSETKKTGEEFLKKEAEKIPSVRKNLTEERLKKIKEGSRDLYF